MIASTIILVKRARREIVDTLNFMAFNVYERRMLWLAIPLAIVVSFPIVLAAIVATIGLVTGRPTTIGIFGM